MFCTECGAQLPEGSRFCSRCGADLSPSLEEETPTAQIQQEATPVADGAQVAATPAPKHSNTKRIVIAAMIAGVLIIGAGAGVFAYLNFFTDTPIDEEHFPDQTFRSFVAANMDADGDGKLSAQEIEQATVVDLSGQTGISDVKGISVFTALQSFNLGPNKVDEVDLSKNNAVTKVSTGAGSTADLKLPSGFDLQTGLDGAANTKVEAGDVVVQAGEWTSDNSGKFGPIQRYNGVLYEGLFSRSDKKIQIPGATDFFGNTDCFYLANGKAYWVDSKTGLGPTASSLYSANIDGSGQKTLTEIVLDSTVYYLNDSIFFRSYEKNKAACEYYDMKTGERERLPAEVTSLVGVCEDRLVVTLKSQASEMAGGTPALAFYDPATKEIASFFSGDTSTYVSNIRFYVSDSGILINRYFPTKSSDASFYSSDGLPVWTEKPFSEIGELKGSSYDEPFMDQSAYYLIRETDSDNHTFTLDMVDLSSSEHKLFSFDLPELPASDGAYQISRNARVIFKDGNSVIVNITEGRYASDHITARLLYRVSLEDGTAELL